MGQRNREALPCTWGQEKTLTNIPLAASVFMEISFQRPEKTIGTCHIDVEELAAASDGELQRFPVSRVRQKNHNKELLGHVLVLPIRTTPKPTTGERSHQSSSSSSSSSRASRDTTHGVGSTTTATKPPSARRSWSSSLRSLVLEFVVFSTLLMVLFGVLPTYVLGKHSLVDVHVHSFVNVLTCTSLHSPFCRDAAALLQRWQRMVAATSAGGLVGEGLVGEGLVGESNVFSRHSGRHSGTPSSDVLMVLVLCGGLLLRLAVALVHCLRSSSHPTVAQHTQSSSSPSSPTNKTTKKNKNKKNKKNKKNTTRATSEDKFSALSTLSFVPVGFVRYVSTTARKNSGLGMTQQHSSGSRSSDGGGTTKVVPVSVRTAVDQAVLSFVNDCTSESGWEYRGKQNGIDCYVGKCLTVVVVWCLVVPPILSVTGLMLKYFCCAAMFFVRQTIVVPGRESIGVDSGSYQGGV